MHPASTPCGGILEAPCFLRNRCKSCNHSRTAAAKSIMLMAAHHYRFPIHNEITMTRFINEPNQIVTDAIDGMLLSHEPDKLKRLDGFPQIKVVVRADADSDRVA